MQNVQLAKILLDDALMKNRTVYIIPCVKDADGNSKGNSLLTEYVKTLCQKNDLYYQETYQEGDITLKGCESEEWYKKEGLNHYKTESKVPRDDFNLNEKGVLTIDYGIEIVSQPCTYEEYMNYCREHGGSYDVDNKDYHWRSDERPTFETKEIDKPYNLHYAPIQFNDDRSMDLGQFVKGALNRDLTIEEEFIQASVKEDSIKAMTERGKELNLPENVIEQYIKRIENTKEELEHGKTHDDDHDRSDGPDRR